MLVKGYGDHNLYRYTWLWFGAFQAISVSILRQKVTNPEVGIPESSPPIEMHATYASHR
jgi:hypothetical protein